MDLLVVFVTWSEKVDLGHCGEEMAWAFWKLLRSLQWSLPATSRLIICSIDPWLVSFVFWIILNKLYVQSRLSVPVLLIAWKDPSPYYVSSGIWNYSLTHVSDAPHLSNSCVCMWLVKHDCWLIKLIKWPAVVALCHHLFFGFAVIVHWQSAFAQVAVMYVSDCEMLIELSLQKS